jgi:NAD(P)H-flavin reductase
VSPARRARLDPQIEARRTQTGTNPYLPAPARVLEIRELAPDTRLFELRFEDLELARTFHYLPGQFVELSVMGVGEAPFSLPSSATRGGRFELAIRRAGSLTGYLFDHLRSGHVVGIRGPLGNGFPMNRFRDQDLVLIAGGLGMVPLRGLLRYLVDLRREFGRITLLYGSRSPSAVLFGDELAAIAERHDADIRLAVDSTAGQPWHGQVGFVTELIDELEVAPDRTHAACCGPPVFYQFVLDRLVAKGFAKDRIHLSLERRMECGIGKCGHCAVGYTFTCLHGPVFTYWDAINLPELIHP